MPPKIPKPEINKTKLPFENEKPKKLEWLFSFKYFRQIKNFGLNKSDSNWFVSLLERFNELSKIDIDTLHKDHKTKNNLRNHLIDWEAKNIPISRNDCNWIDKDIIENEIEYPFVQFQVSKALGRIVGFWDINIFYIVLLDPLHNLQPSEYNDYKIRDCNILTSQYSSLLKDIDDLKRKNIDCKSCNIANDLQNIPTNLNNTNAIVFFLDDDYLEAFKTISKNKSISEIIENGLIVSY